MRPGVLVVGVLAALGWPLAGTAAAEGEGVVLKVTTWQGAEKTLVVTESGTESLLANYALRLSADPEPKLAVNLKLALNFPPERKGCGVLIPWRLVKDVARDPDDRSQKLDQHVITMTDGTKLVGSLLTYVTDQDGQQYMLRECAKVVPQNLPGPASQTKPPKTWKLTFASGDQTFKIERTFQVCAPRFITVSTADHTGCGEVLGDGFWTTFPRFVPQFKVGDTPMLAVEGTGLFIEQIALSKEQQVIVVEVRDPMIGVRATVEGRDWMGWFPRAKLRAAGGSTGGPAGKGAPQFNANDVVTVTEGDYLNVTPMKADDRRFGLPKGQRVLVRDVKGQLLQVVIPGGPDVVGLMQAADFMPPGPPMVMEGSVSQSDRLALLVSGERGDWIWRADLGLPNNITGSNFRPNTAGLKDTDDWALLFDTVDGCSVVVRKARQLPPGTKVTIEPAK